MVSAPSIDVGLDWREDLYFEGVVADAPVTIDGDGQRAISPVQMLAAGLAGCMAIDVVHILTKMRTPPVALNVELTVERAPTDPRRAVSAEMRFVITGEVPDKNVNRALEMSRDTYCSVWHSLREDIPLSTSFEIRGA